MLYTKPIMNNKRCSPILTYRQLLSGKNSLKHLLKTTLKNTQSAKKHLNYPPAGLMFKTQNYDVAAVLVCLIANFRYHFASFIIVQ